MNVVESKDALDEALRALRAAGASLALVPTMGALHEGHLSLVRVARRHADRVAVSIFVNPTQFGPTEDYVRYPRTPEKDLDLLRAEGVELVFMPTVEVMYSHGWSVTVEPGPVGSTFEGAVRPEHFRGVLTVVAKLLNLLRPDCAVFGQKDAQQLFLIRKMVTDLRFPIHIVEGPTVREPDGLAMSSRNVYLKVTEREKAAVLHRSLREGERLFVAGERSLSRMKAAMNGVLRSVSELAPDYATAVSEASFEEEDPLSDRSRLIVAVRLGSVRLIDNLPLHPSDGTADAS